MNECLTGLCSVISENIKKDLDKASANLTELHYILISAYNTYQDMNNDKGERIYDYGENDDLITCLKVGLNADQIKTMVSDHQVKNFTFFFFYGESYSAPEQIQTIEKLTELLKSFVDTIVPNVFCYPEEKGNIEIYRQYITPFIEGVLMEK